MPHLLIEAGPGCGKTFTINKAYRYYMADNKALFIKENKFTEEQINIFSWLEDNIPKPKDKTKLNTIYLAFNVSSKQQLEAVIHPGSKANTHNGWGHSVLQKNGYCKFNEKADDVLVSQIIGQMLAASPQRFQWISTLKYLSHLKQELLTPTLENLELLQYKYNDLSTSPIHKDMIDQIYMLIPKMKEINKTIGINYIDQIWKPLFHLPEPLYELGFVDECQDLSPARLALSFKLCKNLVFVGDKNQGINAFSGADPYSFDKIESKVDHKLTLNQSFRLKEEHVEDLNKLKPGAKLKSTPGNNGGLTEIVDFNLMIKICDEVFETNPLVICRYNAPLIKVALELLKKEIPSKTLGDTFAKKMVNLVKFQQEESIPKLILDLEQYKQKLCKKGSELAKQMNKDFVDCAILLLSKVSSREEYFDLVKKLTAPTRSKNYVLLATIHKAKGLEAYHVFILNPPVQSHLAKKPEELLQEDNLQYVAESRQKKAKYYVIG